MCGTRRGGKASAPGGLRATRRESTDSRAATCRNLLEVRVFWVRIERFASFVDESSREVEKRPFSLPFRYLLHGLRGAPGLAPCTTFWQRATTARASLCAVCDVDVTAATYSAASDGSRPSDAVNNPSLS